MVGANNFAVALALGALGQRRRRWRIAGVVGAFEFLVPLVGLAIGSAVADSLADVGRWVGAALLATLALVALRAASRDSPQDDELAARVTSWNGLVGLAAGLSLDNLIVGFALGLGDVSPLLLAGVIAFCSVSFTLLGLQLGHEGRRRWQAPAQAGAGIALLALALAVAAGWIT